MSIDHGTVVIVGSGLRGLWLSASLQSLGYRVTWIQAQKFPQGADAEFQARALPWQVGVAREDSPALRAVQDFVTNVLKPKNQKLSLQIKTSKGALELSGPARIRSLKWHFPESYKDIVELLDVVHENSAPSSVVAAHLARLAKRPFAQRWILDWLCDLRRPAVISALDWVVEEGGKLLDPQGSLLYLEESPIEVAKRAMLWAEKQGVQVIRDAEISDFGLEGSRVSGVELKGQGKFINSDQLVFAVSVASVLDQNWRLSSKLGLKKKDLENQWIWIKCRVELRKGSRPEGMEKITSILRDPWLPHSYDNLLVLRWDEQDKEVDHLTIWNKIQFEDSKNRDLLASICDEIQRELAHYVPGFEDRLVAFHPFVENSGSPLPRFEDRPVVRKKIFWDRPMRLKLKNVLSIAPEHDRGLELLSALATEVRLFETLKAEALKREKKIDRKIHASRNGKDLVATK